MTDVLLDSNLIIYAARPDDRVVNGYIESVRHPFASEASLVEALGFHSITPDEAAAITRIIATVNLLAVDRSVIIRRCVSGSDRS